MRMRMRERMKRGGAMVRSIVARAYFTEFCINSTVPLRKNWSSR